MSGLNDEALLQEFIAESREHLSSIEPDLLILEREEKNTDIEIINRIFRAIHSIKGASGFFGLEALKCLSHSMENTLMQLRDGKLLPCGEVMDPLLIGVDRLRVMLEDIQVSEQVVYQDIVEQLEKLTSQPVKKTADEPLENLVEPGVAPQEVSSIFDIERSVVENSIRHGQKLYIFQLSLDQDFYQTGRDPVAFQDLLSSTGSILESNVVHTEITGLQDCLIASLTWNMLYATVLEGELVQLTFELSESQLQEVNIDDLYASAKMAPLPVVVKPVATEVIDAQERPVAESEAKGRLSPKASSTIQNNDSNETIRVKVDLLNRLMDLAGELVLARNQLTRIFESQANKSGEMSNIIQNVDLVTSDLQEHIMQTRMQAISSVFGKFPRLVRDLSRQLQKEITLEMSGEEVELDKSILESLSDPLTHLIRNCCDHAMELPATRESVGKPRQGTVLLKAYQESGHINIAVIDDGAGIDHEKVAKKALESGIISEATLRQMTPQEQVNLIFMPGFSTAEAVTDVSGRGVGMDVVRTNIEQIGGSITIETEKGKGTTIQLRLPLTLAIIPSLIVSACDQTFAVPQINLVELVCVKASQIATRIEKVGTASVLRLRGKLLPLIKLSSVLGLQDEYFDEDGQTMPDKRQKIHDERLENADVETGVMERRNSPLSDYNILVLKAGSRQYGLIVDEIRDIEEIVVKPLSSFIKNCRCFSGATIMGDGTVAMILDVAGIITISNLLFSELNGEEQNRKQHNSKDGGSMATVNRSVLLFNNAADEIFALPVDSILRLEKIQMSSIEKVGNQKFLPYQGKSMSLIYLHEHLPVTPINIAQEEAYLIIPAESQCRLGIIASSILDTVDFDQPLDETSIKNECISGSAVINNHVTLFIEPEKLRQSAGFTKQDKRSTEWQAGHLQHSS